MPILLAFFASALRYLTGPLVVKWLVSAFIYGLCLYSASLLASFIPSFLTDTPFSAYFSNIPSSVWYLIDYFKVFTGIQLISSSYVSRFILRRIPLVG